MTPEVIGLLPLDLGNWFARTAHDGSLVIAVPVALVAGLVSFFSPCVVPLLPGYLSYATGLSGAENTAIAMAQSAANHMVSAVRPGSGPLQMLSQAADSTDRIAALIAKATRGDAGN